MIEMKFIQNVLNSTVHMLSSFLLFAQSHRCGSRYHRRMGGWAVGVWRVGGWSKPRKVQYVYHESPTQYIARPGAAH